ncbi:uncharacterized protein Gasu_00350 [Galdieria sulphuraria]|uniref:Uncharacterized protein n=1 Tax=Galdieria sulphuraria TaxID=130081 RepID=M2Y990_GALSU|nr:uncharacterized protein Gasu_00350 [Galdieria sulphuraria]EME32663.1 hypothetical protein Gasu_00350 [Galdieria sulphuraria]|eukprot:XP_005709183.1 hypothetical protein Gasu_00350 [Galdieria sulphuraria]
MFHIFLILGSSLDPQVKDFLEKLKRATRLFVDLRSFDQVPPEERNFKWIAHHLMLSVAYCTVKKPEPDPSQPQPRPEVVLGKFEIC